MLAKQTLETLETFRTVEEELFLFGGSVLLGFPAGILFDITRLCRKIFPHKLFSVAIEDILFLLCSSVMLLCYASAFGRGEFRFYYSIGCLCGFVFYYCTLGKIIMQCSDLLLLPFHWIGNRFVRICRKIRRSFVKCSQNSRYAKKSIQNNLPKSAHRVYNKYNHRIAIPKKAGLSHAKYKKSKI